MDSPEPGSPASSSDSPGFEDAPLPSVQESSYSFTNTLRSEPYPSSGKRRMPASSAGSSVKNRRRDDVSNRRPMPSTSTWQAEHAATTRSSRDELLDNQLVDKIRADWGDPFDLNFLKSAS